MSWAEHLSNFNSTSSMQQQRNNNYELENLIKDSNKSEDIGIAARKTIQSKHDINMLNIKLIDSFKGLYN